MFCTECGKKLEDSAKFCSHCGHPAEIELPQKNERKKHSKKSGWIKLVAISLAVSICVFLVVILIDHDSDLGSSDHGGKSESLFSNLVDYKLDGLLFRVPEDMEWEDEDIFEDEVSLDAENIMVFAELYDSDDLKNCDVENKDEFVDFIARIYKQNRGDYEDPVIESFRNGKCIIIEGETRSSVIGVYMKGDRGWVIGVHILDPDQFDAYYDVAEFIATSGVFRS